MGFKASKWARETRGHRTPTDKFVLLTLASKADDTDYRVWYPRDDLLADLGVSRRTLIYSLTHLKEQGFLSQVKHGNQYQISVYQLHKEVQLVALAQDEEVQSTTQEVQPIALGSATSCAAYKEVSSQSSLISSPISSPSYPKWALILSKDPRWEREEWNGTIQDIESAFTGVDLEVEALKAYEWFQRKGKAKKKMKRTWLAWLDKAKKDLAVPRLPFAGGASETAPLSRDGPPGEDKYEKAHREQVEWRERKKQQAIRCL